MKKRRTRKKPRKATRIEKLLAKLTPSQQAVIERVTFALLAGQRTHT